MGYGVYEERYSGMRAMWLKVMIRAAFDWVSYRDHHDPRKLRDARESEAWLFHGWGKGFNSFESLCRLLDISPKGVRLWASSLSKDQVAKIEHLDRSCTGRALDAILPRLEQQAEDPGGLEHD